MAAKLIVEEGDLEGFVLSFDEGTEWVIGRDPDEAKLLVEDPTVSRRHARCYLDKADLFIENLGDTNPIEVNSEVIDAPTPLKQGDTVTIGSQVFRFYQETTAHLFEEKQEQGEKKNHEEEEMETVHESLFEEGEGGTTTLAEINFDLLESGRWLLKVVGGPNNGAEFSMQLGREYLIGTDPSLCDIVFHDTSVSRQHARLWINEDETLSIEDLGSRNGTLIDGKRIEGQVPLQINTVISMGTTVFVVYDREGEMQTIISPLLPSIVKMLQGEDREGESTAKQEKNKAVEQEVAAEPKHSIKGFILLGLLAAFLAAGGIGIINLFQPSRTVQTAAYQGDIEGTLKRVFSAYPGLKYSYNTNTGNLLIIGHVVTPSQKQELLYSLQGLPFIRSIEDTGVIIDELIWQEINQVLARNPQWKGVSVSTPQPGRFVMTGYLKTRKSAEDLLNYVGINFPYISGLQKNLVIEEEIDQHVRSWLRTQGLNDVLVKVENGEITFTGTVSSANTPALDQIVAEAKKIPGVRGVRSFISEITAPKGIIDITDEYEVTGSSSFGGKISVVVNGRIISVGDVLDGRNITRISSNEILLQGTDGKQYRIRY